MTPTLTPYVAFAALAAIEDLRTRDVDAIVAWVAEILPPEARREIDASPGGLRGFVVAVLGRDDDATDELPRRTVQ